MHPLPSGCHTKAGGGLDAQELDLALEIVVHVHASVVVTQVQAIRGGGREAPEVFAHVLADRFDGFEPGGLFHRVDSHAIAGAMVNGSERRDVPLCLREDGGWHPFPTCEPAPRPRSSPRAGYQYRRGPARRGEQLVCTEKTQDAVLGSAHPFEAQPRPDLAIPFDHDGLCQQSSDLGHQFLIGPHLGATLFWLPRMLWPLASGVETGTRQAPHCSDSSHTVRWLLEGETVRLMLSTSTAPKGGHSPGERSSPATARFSTLMLATTDFNRRRSSSSTSDSRLFKPPHLPPGNDLATRSG